MKSKTFDPPAKKGTSEEKRTVGMEFGQPGVRVKKNAPKLVRPPVEFAQALLKTQGYDKALQILDANRKETFGQAPNLVTNEDRVYYENAYSYLKNRDPKKKQSA